MSELVQVHVRGLILDERSKSPIVILKEESGNRVLPIWIGEAEARAINMIMSREKIERPMTHDLLLLMIKSFKARVKKVTITSLKEHTFFADIHVEGPEGEQILVDARPSDSVAVALRAEAPIYVAEEVLRSSGQPGLSVQPTPMSKEEKAAKLRKLLEDMNPGDFGDFGI